MNEGRGLRILVVDDSPTNLTVVKGLLRTIGADADTAVCGQKAVELVREGAARYDLIFMDHMMPGMDGVETVRAIREDVATEYAKTVPIIALTASGKEGIADMFAANGFQGCILKPLTPDRLKEAVRAFAGGAARPEGPGGADGRRPRKASPRDGKRQGGGPETPGREIAGIDFDRGLEINGNNEDIYWEALATFVESTPPMLDKIRADAAAGDLDDLQILAHGIKGAGRMVGVLGVADLAEQAEFAAQRLDRESARRCVAALLPEAEALVKRMSDAVARHAVAHPRPVRPRPDAGTLGQMLRAVRELDIDGMDAAMAELNAYDYTSGNAFVQWLDDQVGGGMEIDAMVKLLTAELSRQGAPASEGGRR